MERECNNRWLIENKNEIVEEKVPVLGDIPVLGGLF